jgi:hypothetical protein
VKGAHLSALPDDDVDLSIVHADGEYRFAMASGEIDVSTGGQDQVTAALFTDFRVSVTFPGEVTSHNGSSTVEGTTVTWTDASDLTSGEGLRATADEPGSVLALLPWLGAALLVAAGVVAGVLLVNRRARATGRPAAGAPQWGPPPGAGYPAQPGQGYPLQPGGYPPQPGGYPIQPGQGYPPQSVPPQRPPRVGDYADPSFLDSPPPEEPPREPPRSPWAAPR